MKTIPNTFEGIISVDGSFYDVVKLDIKKNKLC